MRPITPNISRGLIRLSMLFLVSWSVYWAWNYFDASEKAKDLQEAIEFASDRQIENDSAGNRAGRDFWYGLVKEHLDSRDEEWRRQENAQEVGLWGGGLFLLLVWGGYWTYLGFSSEARRGISWKLAGWWPVKNAQSERTPTAQLQEIDTQSSPETDLRMMDPSAFDGKRLRKTLYWGVTLVTLAEFFLRSVLSGGEDRGTNVVIFLAIGVMAWLVGRLTRSETAAAWIFGILSLGFLGLSLSRFVT